MKFPKTIYLVRLIGTGNDKNGWLADASLADAVQSAEDQGERLVGVYKFHRVAKPKITRQLL